MNDMQVSLSTKERLLGGIYGLLEFFLLPYAAQLAGLLWNIPVWGLNCGLFVLNAVCLSLLMRRFLADNLRCALRFPWKTLRFAAVGLVLYYLGSMLMGMLILVLRPDYLNLNDQSVSAMVSDGGIWMGLATVLCVPLAEELLFRGVLLRGLYDRSPVLAVCLSSGLFSLAHVAGYIGIYDPAELALAFLQYLPAGLALAFAYRRSGNILAPVLMHMAINQISLSLLV